MTKRPRFLLVDAVRGAAIIGVVIYHFVWDLRFMRFTSYDPIFDPVWLGFAKVLLASFLVLAGVSLVLAHKEQTNWRAFFKRFGILAGAAILVSIGTYIAFQDGFVYFGILHALALFSLMAVFFVRVPIWLVAALAAFFLFLPFYVQSDLFNAKILTWIGFWTVEPYTQDLVPMFPGLGFVLAGIVLMRGILGWPLGKRALALQSKGFWFRWLVKAGRWSLVIYLVHQPILFGVLTPLANWVQPGQVVISEAEQSEEVQKEMFYNSCVSFYVSSQSGEGDGVTDRIRADSYCACAADMMDENDLLGVQHADDLTAQQATKYGAIPQLCQAMAGE